MKLKHPAAIVGLLLLLGLLLFTFFYKLSLQPVYVWDEARRANDSLQMFLRGEWVIDFYDGDPTTRSTKSPLLLWLQVGCLYLFGVNEWALRFPSALASVTIGFLIWLFCFRYFKSNVVGILAGSVFATSLAWVMNHAGRTGDYDAVLTLFTTLYVFCLFTYSIKLNNKWLRYFWLFLTLAVLIKGVAGLFYVPGLVIFLIVINCFKTLFHNKWMYAGMLFFTVVIGGYYLLREWHAPGFLQAVYNNELGGRYLDALEYNGQPAHYYFSNFTWRFPFWIYLLIPAYIAGYFSQLKTIKTFTLFNTILSLSFLVIISSSKTKLFWYDLPLYPLFSIQIGLLLHQMWQWLQSRVQFIVSNAVEMPLAAVMFLLVFTWPFYAIYKHNNAIGNYLEDREQGLYLQQAILQKKDLNNYTFLYEDYDRHISYYIKRLHRQNVNVQLTHQLKTIKPGSYVVLSQDSTIQKFLKHFVATKEEEKFGCHVYYIQEYKNYQDYKTVSNTGKPEKATIRY